LSPATTGLTIAEGKTILESLQKGIVAAQVEHRGVSMKACLRCGAALRRKVITTLCCGPFTAMCPSAFDGCEGAAALSIPQADRRFSRTTTRSRRNSNILPPNWLRRCHSAGWRISSRSYCCSRRKQRRAQFAMKVSRRLQNSAEALTVSARRKPCERAVVGLDGGYVRSRHRRSEYNFEVVAGKVLDQEGSGACFAFVRDGGSAGESAAALAMRRSGVNESTSVTVLTFLPTATQVFAAFSGASLRRPNGRTCPGLVSRRHEV
jgi:hypothetical protein